MSDELRRQAMLTCKVESGFLIEGPIPLPKDVPSLSRLTHWLAIITRDPMGVQRQFCKHGTGLFLYSTQLLKVHDAVEFGINELPGKRKWYGPRPRWYGLVKDIAADHVNLLPVPTMDHAIDASIILRYPSSEYMNLGPSGDAKPKRKFDLSI